MIALVLKSMMSLTLVVIHLASLFVLEVLNSKHCNFGLYPFHTFHYFSFVFPLVLNVLQSRIPSSSIEYTEEFDFEAMNEKFKKSELWGYLGRNNQRNQNDYGEETAIEPNAEGKVHVFSKFD